MKDTIIHVPPSRRRRMEEEARAQEEARAARRAPQVPQGGKEPDAEAPEAASTDEAPPKGRRGRSRAAGDDAAHDEE